MLSRWRSPRPITYPSIDITAHERLNAPTFRHHCSASALAHQSSFARTSRGVSAASAMKTRLQKWARW